MIWLFLTAACFIAWANKRLNGWLDNKLCRALEWVLNMPVQLFCRLGKRHKPEWCGPVGAGHKKFGKDMWVCSVCYHTEYRDPEPDPLTKFVEEVERPEVERPE